jgi:hypothetical protein
MACELHRSDADITTDIGLFTLEGKPLGNLLPERGESVPMLIARWSPDSAFLVYVATIKEKGTVVYQGVRDLNNLHAPANHHALNTPTPSTYCNGACGPLGEEPKDPSGNFKVGTDYLAFPRQAEGQGRPKWLALTVMEPLQNPTGTQKYQRIIYGIPLYGSSNPIRIRAPYGDAGYATFSPNSVVDAGYRPTLQLVRYHWA